MISDFFLALLLALIQGLTEFLPVSSSAQSIFLRDKAELGKNGPAILTKRQRSLGEKAQAERSEQVLRPLLATR